MFFAKAPIAAIFLILLAASQSSAEVSISTDAEGRTQMQVGRLKVDSNYRQRHRRIKKANRYNHPISANPQGRSTTDDAGDCNDDSRRSDRYSRSTGAYQRSTQTVTVNGRSHTVTQTTTSD
jgi:hypothetical protein